MSFDRTIVLDSEQQLRIALAIVSRNWKAMAESGHPMAMRLYEHKDQRTLEQQGLMWIRLAEIAKQAWVNGQQFSDEAWHEHFKREFLPDEEGPTKRCRKHYRKWLISPLTGERAMVGSTTQLTTFGMAEYLTQVMAFGADEFGVRYSATPDEVRRAA